MKFEPGAHPPAAPRQTATLPALLVVAVTLAVFGQTARFGSVFIDDYLYVAEPVTRGLTWAGVRWSFANFRVANWHPLTWLSLMLDAQLWGAWLGGWHLTSALLHAANAALLFTFLRRVGGSPGRSAIAAALFALHPLRAESVAWLSERKDVLSATFFLLTLLAYAGWVERRSAARAAVVVGALAAGLLAKPMLVTTPFVLLLLDFWPLRRPERERWPALWLEKVPLFLLCLIEGGLTLVAQNQSGAVAPLHSLPLIPRLATAAMAIPRYLALTFWPAHLVPFYGIDQAAPVAPAVAAALGILLVSAAAFRARRRFPQLFVGWFWFAGMLMPTLGLLQVGSQALADRYTYLPHIGLIGALVFSVPAPGTRAGRWLAGAAAALVLAALSIRCYGQVASWKDTQELIASAARAAPDSSLGLIGRAVAAERRGDLDEALALFARVPATGMNPAFIHYGIGKVELRKREPARAAAEFAEAVKLEPSSSEFRRSWAAALELAGQPASAARTLRDLLARDPRDVDARVDLGLLLGRGGEDRAAAAELVRAAAERNDDARLQLNAGIALARIGRYSEAVRYFEAAVALRPDIPGASSLIEQARRDAKDAAASPPAP